MSNEEKMDGPPASQAEKTSNILASSIPPGGEKHVSIFLAFDNVDWAHKHTISVLLISYQFTHNMMTLILLITILRCTYVYFTSFSSRV